MKEFKDKIENMDMEELIKYREKLSQWYFTQRYNLKRLIKSTESTR
jgi:hypothetical protein